MTWIDYDKLLDELYAYVDAYEDGAGVLSAEDSAFVREVNDHRRWSPGTEWARRLRELHAKIEEPEP